MDATTRPTALRANISAQMQKPELSPFISQILVAGNWYRGYDYDVADKAIQEMYAEWLKVTPEDQDYGKVHKDILERASAKVNQTMIPPKNNL